MHEEASAAVHDPSHGLTWVRESSNLSADRELVTRVSLNNTSDASVSLVLNGFGLQTTLISPRIQYTGPPLAPAPPAPLAMVIPPFSRVRFEDRTSLASYEYELGARMQVVWLIGSYGDGIPAVAWGNFELILEH